MAMYLNIEELAALLEVSPRSVKRRLKSAPWDVPSPAHLGPGFPLRWRAHEVRVWMYEHGRCGAPSSSVR